jgi:hypothetical protein
MSVKIVILIAAAVVLVGGSVAAYIVIKNNGDQAESLTQTPEQQDDSSASINSLLAQNRNVVCTYSGVDSTGNQNSGTVYLTGERFRGNFTLKQPGEDEYKSNTLQNETYQYGWEEGKKEGYKTKLSVLRGDADAPASNNNQQTFDQDKEFNFNCDDWTVDESKFEVPSGIKFTDFSATVEQSREQLQTTCSAITDATAREVCESAL